MTRWKRDLSRLDGVLRVEETNKQHLRLTLTNGRFVIAPLSTTNRHALHDVRRYIRRELLQGGSA